MSNIDRILSGDKEALAKEICDAIEWARALTVQDYHNITHDANGGLHGVVCRIVDKGIEKKQGAPLILKTIN